MSDLRQPLSRYAGLEARECALETNRTCNETAESQSCSIVPRLVFHLDAPPFTGFFKTFTNRFQHLTSPKALQIQFPVLYCSQERN